MRSRSACPTTSRTITRCCSMGWLFTTRCTPGASPAAMKRISGRRSWAELRRAVAIAAAVSCGAGFAAAGEPGSPLPLTRVADVPLPGDTSRFDYASYDAERHRLFIAHLGQSEVVVFDARTQRVVARI